MQGKKGKCKDDIKAIPWIASSKSSDQKLKNFGLKYFLSASCYFYSQNIDIELRKCTANQFHPNEFACTFPKPPSRLKKTGQNQFYISCTQKPARVKWFVIPVAQLNAFG